MFLQNVVEPCRWRSIRMSIPSVDGTSIKISQRVTWCTTMSSFCHGQAVQLYPQRKYDIEYIEMNPEMKTNLRKERYFVTRWQEKWSCQDFQQGTQPSSISLVSRCQGASWGCVKPPLGYGNPNFMDRFEAGFVWWKISCIAVGICWILFSVFHFAPVKIVIWKSWDLKGNPQVYQIHRSKCPAGGESRFHQHSFDEHSSTQLHLTLCGSGQHFRTRWRLDMRCTTSKVSVKRKEHNLWTSSIRHL